MVQMDEGATMISALAVGDLVAWILERLSSIPVVGALLMVAATALVVMVCRSYDRSVNEEKEPVNAEHSPERE